MGKLVDEALNQGAAAVDLEWTDQTHTDFETNLRILDLLLNWQP